MFFFFIFIKNYSCQKRQEQFFNFLISLKNLFSFKAIATSTMLGIAIADIAYVDLSQRAIIASAIVLTFGHTATDAAVYFTFIFVHHIKIPPLKV